MYCDICYCDRHTFTGCLRCYKSICTDCFRRLTKHNCPFCRYMYYEKEYKKEYETKYETEYTTEYETEYETEYDELNPSYNMFRRQRHLGCGFIDYLAFLFAMSLFIVMGISVFIQLSMLRTFEYICIIIDFISKLSSINVQ